MLTIVLLVICTNLMRMIVDNGVSGSGGGIELDSYNNLFMRRCVLSG